MTNVVIWARVSSREQREGYSIDAQIRITRERAQKEGWVVLREFLVAESAKRGAERLAFNEMFKWVRSNARRLKIGFILAHKLDRVCRNMRDAVRLQELEDTCGVKLAFVDNQFGPGAAGALSFNVMAAVAQYYSDNLRSEVLKGMDEKVRQGWPTGLAPYGYVNVKGDDEAPIQPHPTKRRAVERIFELYSTGTTTFEKIADLLEREGFVYRASQPRFSRTAIGYILDNRFYIGELVRHGRTYPGKFAPIIDRDTFELCQQIKHGRNRRTGSPDCYLAGGLFQCGHCGYSITGERVIRRMVSGKVWEYRYYRCGNIYKKPDHPKVRWSEEDLAKAVVRELANMRIQDDQTREWFREGLASAFADLTRLETQRLNQINKRLGEIKAMHERLLDTYLAGTLDEGRFSTKSVELRNEETALNDQLQKMGEFDPAVGRAALAVFDFVQNAAARWESSNKAVRREILGTILLKRTLSDVSLCVEKRKPFDLMAEGLSIDDSRGDWI